MAGFQMDNYHQHMYVPGSAIETPKTKWIWKVFWILLIITTVEVSFAFWNEGGRHLPLVFQKWFFITLTLVKAYYIVFSFMHLGDEKFNFKLTISLTSVLFVYFIVLMMFEGHAVHDIRLIIPDFIIEAHQMHGGAAEH
jgi:cytochrome c oxidase subunit IV